MSVQTGLMTVEEFLRLPPAKEGHYELHHGEVVLMPPVKWGHTWTQRQIQKLLERHIGDHGFVGTEVPFRPSLEYEVWEADVAFVRSERADSVGSNEYLAGAPDLVVEVLSPSNTVDEINDRMSICLENGCVSFWVVDPKRKRVSVTEGDVTRHYGLLGSISCCLFDAAIPVREIFQ